MTVVNWNNRNVHWYLQHENHKADPKLYKTLFTAFLHDAVYQDIYKKSENFILLNFTVLILKFHPLIMTLSQLPIK